MLTIRPMTAGDDFAAVASLYVASWQHAYRGLVPQRYLDKLSPEGWSSLLRAEPEANLIMLRDEQIIGTAYVTFARDEEREGYGEIVALYLLPKCTGQGYGKPLLQAALEQCRNQGLSDVCLWVLEGNQPARRFYERMGFRPSGRTKTEAIGGQQLPLTEYLLGLE